MPQEGGDSKFQSQVSEYLWRESAVSDKISFDQWLNIEFQSTFVPDYTYDQDCLLYKVFLVSCAQHQKC